jgi:hypothetical protein
VCALSASTAALQLSAWEYFQEVHHGLVDGLAIVVSPQVSLIQVGAGCAMQEHAQHTLCDCCVPGVGRAAVGYDASNRCDSFVFCLGAAGLQDQIYHLQQSGIPAEALSAQQDWQQQRAIIDG